MTKRRMYITVVMLLIAITTAFGNPVKSFANSFINPDTIIAPEEAEKYQKKEESEGHKTPKDSAILRKAKIVILRKLKTMSTDKLEDLLMLYMVIMPIVLIAIAIIITRKLKKLKFLFIIIPVVCLLCYWMAGQVASVYIDRMIVYY